VPPLRERRGDLPFYVERLLERGPKADAAQTMKLTSEVWNVLQRYAWPGNLRELSDVLNQACLQAKGAVIEVSDLPAGLRLPHEAPELAEGGLPLDTILEQVERRLLELALRRTGGNKSRAADLLGMQRPRLFRRLKALGLAPGDDTIEIEEAE
jgi:DNA-binding NtrC family response regulator